MQKYTKFKILFLLSFLGLAGCSQSPITWWKSFNQKAKHLSEIEAKYEALKKEHEALQEKFYRLEGDYVSMQGSTHSKEVAEYNLHATGSIVGRSLASISYHIPQGISLGELQLLAYEHMREKRFEEAAICFEKLFSVPEAAIYQTGSNFYSSAVAWYQVNNFQKARENFEAASSHAEGEEKEKITRKVDLWLRAIDRKLASVHDAHHGG